MENEKLILEKISNIEAQLEPLVRPTLRNQELKDDLMPLMNQGMAMLIEELLDVGSSFDLGDFFELIKQVMRSTNNINYSLKQLGNVIEFIQDVEPLMKSAVPQLIGYLDNLEKAGVLRIIVSALDVRAKIAKAYSADDIDAIGDGFVVMLGLAKQLTDPKSVEFINKLMGIPGDIDLKNVKSAGVGKLMTAGFDSEIQAGLGVMLELTKAMGKLKS